MQLKENMKFANRYELVKLLGRGGFSEVWLAKDNWTHLDIALKVYAPGQGMDANGLNEFCGELANVFDLNHTNLLKPTHVDSYDDMPYLIMAYCSRGSLKNYIGKATEEQVWKIIKDVSAGLAYLHGKGVVHQDISPDNILIDEDGNYLITDFGISNRARSTLRKSVIKGTSDGGKIAYMGPERFSKQPTPINASDIWSFGAMLFELLEGNVPFGEMGGVLQKSGAEIPTINAEVSEQLKTVITRMLSLETWDRPTAQTLIDWEKDRKTIPLDGQTKLKPIQNKPTQPLQNNPTVPIGRNDNKINETYHQEHSDDKYKKKTTWIVIVIAIVVLSTIGITASVIDRQMKEKKIREELYSTVRTEQRKFTRSYNLSSIDNIESLNDAVEAVHSMAQTEAHKLYNQEKVASVLRRQLRGRIDSLYDVADRKYKNAPIGTATEARNLEKRDRISEIKNNL